MSAGLQVHRPASLAQAMAVLHEQPGTRPVGGGTELVTLLRSGLTPHTPLMTMATLGLDQVALHGDQLVLGAGARMADVARSPLVLREAPAVAQALLASASPQVRNVATLGGNLLQRTRCPYFRGGAPACNKRVPGSGCAVHTGEQRHAALFGASAQCCATHASDLAVALLALDATLVVQGPRGERRLPLEALHLEPAHDAGREHSLSAGELITAIALPCSAAARASRYLKVRDRASFQFALVSLAVALECRAGTVAHARLAAGGVGTRPWRLHTSEAALAGQPATPATWQSAARAATQGAEPLPGNAFKLDLLQRCIEHALAPSSPGDHA
ncbi:MAG: FAD binding domain-containing protein [Rhizobacter sp.]|nr:FAD binding domain-containing protein [Rhizobacter sp.]